MTRYLAVTTCNAEQWTKYGRAMATTFCRHWPAHVPLWVYSEGFGFNDAKNLAEVSVNYRPLDVAAPWLAEFKRTYRGTAYRGGIDGRDYRRDAVRFSHKVAAIGAAAEEAECDVLIWMDADIVTHARVTAEWLDSLFPPPATVAWLDRERAYPECGFLMFRMPDAKKVISNIVMMYRTGALFQLPEWHDSYVIQHVVDAMVQRGKAKVHSLSGPEGRKYCAHPFVASELASRMDHLKGESRKQIGRSSLGDHLKAVRTEEYWRESRKPSDR